jgi:hypothetical protein
VTAHRRSLQGLLVVRALLVSNGVILACFAVLYAIFGSTPSGYVIAGVLGAAAIGLWLAVPLTDPYRAERSGHRRSW